MRRNRSSNADPSRVRKISLQNDYAFGIISPVSSTTLPVRIPNGKSEDVLTTIPCIIVGPWQVENRKFDNFDPDVDLGEDPLSDYSSSNSGTIGSFSNSSSSTSSERFRRWSVSNFQSAFKAIQPSGTEASSQFTSDEEGFGGSRQNLFCSYSNLRVGSPAEEDYGIQGFITSIPERIRKISSEKRPTPETNIYYPNESLKKELQKVYVY